MACILSTVGEMARILRSKTRTSFDTPFFAGAHSPVTEARDFMAAVVAVICFVRWMTPAFALVNFIWAFMLYCPFL